MNYKQRMRFYRNTEGSHGQLNAGEGYSILPPIISVWIFKESVTDYPSTLSEIYPSRKPDSRYGYDLFDDEERTIIFELAKKEMIPDCYDVPLLGTWQDFFNQPDSVWTRAIKIPGMEEAMENLSEVSKNKEDRELAMRRARSLRLQQNAVAMAERKGRADKATEIAKELIADGYRDVSKLVKITKLSQKQIEQLL